MPGIPSFSSKNHIKPHLPEGNGKLLLSQIGIPTNLKKQFVALVLLAFCIFFGLYLFFTLQKEPSSPHQHLISLKAPCPDFIGREESLKLLHKELIEDSSLKELKTNARIKVLWGKGGFGKSELAIEFANRYIADFSLIWTFLSDTQEHIDQGYSCLAEALGLSSSQKESPEKIRARVHFYLENHHFKKPWLLIFDNVENELSETPQRGGVILATSQKKILNPDFLLEIPPLSKEESIELLEKITKAKRDPKMELLVEDLDNIPLLINYAAHYIKATPGLNISEYQKLFSSHIIEKEGPLWKEDDANRRYLKSLVASWEFPLKSLRKENPLALEWLYVCSYLYPEHIPEDWMNSWLAQKGIEQVQLQKNEILKTLQNYGIIRYEPKTNTFALHRFFQYMLRESRKEELESDLGQTVCLLADYAINYRFQGTPNWKLTEWWYLNAKEVKKILDSQSVQFSDPFLRIRQASLYEGIAEWSDFNDRYLMSSLEEALDSANQVLKLRTSALPHDASEIGHAYEQIARILCLLDRYEEALKACNQAEAINSRFAKEKPLGYALSLATKGRILFEQGNYEEALKCHQETLRIRQEHLGLHSHVGRSMNSNTICLRELGRYKEAMALHNEGLAIYEKTCGKDHPWFFTSLQNKAWTLFKQGNFQEALTLFNQALSHLITIQGETYGNLIDSWNGIGWCSIEMGDLPAAKKAFEKALRIGLVNENRRSLIKSYNGLGWCYLKDGQVDKGLKYFEQQLLIGSELYQNTPKMTSILEDFQKALILAEKSGGSPDSIAHAKTQLIQNKF